MRIFVIVLWENCLVFCGVSHCFLCAAHVRLVGLVSGFWLACAVRPSIIKGRLRVMSVVLGSSAVRHLVSGLSIGSGVSEGLVWLKCWKADGCRLGGLPPCFS